MNGLFRATAGPGPGLFPTQIDGYGLYNRTGSAVALGDVLMVDLLASATEATTLTPGSAASAFANLVVPSAGAIAGTAPALLAVVTGLGDVGTGADNTQVDVRVFGLVDAFVIGASGSMAVGTDLVATAAKNFDIVTATGEVIVGIGNEAVATPTTRTLGEVFVGANLLVHSASA